MKRRITVTSKLARWLLTHIIMNHTPKFECTRVREMAIDDLMKKGYTHAHAKVILSRAWARAKLTPIKEWPTIRHDQVQQMTIAEAMGRNLILDAINNQPEEPTAIKESAKVVSALSDLDDAIAGFKL